MEDKLNQIKEFIKTSYQLKKIDDDTYNTMMILIEQLKLKI